MRAQDHQIDGFLNSNFVQRVADVVIDDKARFRFKWQRGLYLAQITFAF
jgi:hypothetical protein